MNIDELIKLLPILISTVTNGASAIESIIEHLKQNTELTDVQEQALKDAEELRENQPWYQQQA